ncbi:SAV_2336 N-terminal domain-related protein [Actinacidiphila glaucinigra]|uniref:SAV_2336 N-terminal domain-related protein n=1 Tax=Actinacidiphila glaucinigra TaxID=235986 RepID=UPI0036BA1CC5
MELSHEELLDVLWLAGKLPRYARPLIHAAGTAAAPLQQHGTPDQDEPTPAHNGASSAAEATATKPTNPESVYPLIASNQARTDKDTQTPSAPSPAVAVRTPDSCSLGTGQRRLGKSLRPLRQRFPDRSRHELDILRTVAAIADTHVPETVTRPARTRWLTLALVIDDGISMVLWQRLAADIRTLMERAGAFRDVRVYGLDTRVDTPALWTSPFRRRTRSLSPKTLCDSTGNTLVLIVSDGVGQAWWNGGMRQVTERWGRCGPTAIVHTLPPRLWTATGIRARRWQVTTHRRGGAPRAWNVTDPELPPDLVCFDSVPIPVLTPTPDAIADWAQLIASQGGTALLPLWDGDRPLQGLPAADPREADPAEVVRRFREAASAQAYRLAAHVAAVAPATPPVMRMVQTALGPPTDPGHLMEVFLGGLMYEVGAGEPEQLPHTRRFDFAVEARRVLLSTVSPKELLRTTEVVTQRIEAAVGRAPRFPAWVGHPSGAALVDDTGRSFGWLREQLLTRLGIPSAYSSSATPERMRSQTPESVAESFSTREAVRSGPSEEVSEQEVMPYDVAREFLQAGWVELLPEDPVRLGRFRLRARSARGWRHMAMYLAWDEDDTIVTVRVPLRLHVDDPEAALDLVRREAECLRRMRGTYAPALVEVQADTDRELPWIAATCFLRRTDDSTTAPAPNLRAVFDEHGGSIPEDLFLRIGFGMSEALAHAHRLGLVHGSLAPRAVLVTDHGVGLVGWMTATVDGTDSIYRDLFPVSDTYLDAGDVGLFLTPQSDVYAAGALLLAFHSGRWNDPRANGKRGPLTTHGIDPALSRMLWRCLEPEPGRRPSAAALAEAFAAASSGPAAARASERFLMSVAEDIQRMRSLTEQDLTAHGPSLCSNLMTYSNHLAVAGRHNESLAAAQEAVAVYRELSSEDNGAYTAGLGAALSNLSVRLAEADRLGESVDVCSEAETVYQELVQGDFVRFGPGLAMVLNNLSNHLARTGRSGQALTAVESAVDLERRLSELVRHDRRDALARVLTTLGSRLCSLGRREQALETVEEAAQIYRLLPQDQVRGVSRDLAVTLNNLAVLLGDLERHEEALSTVDESLAVQRSYGHEWAAAASSIRERSDHIRIWLVDLLAEAHKR